MNRETVKALKLIENKTIKRVQFQTCYDDEKGCDVYDHVRLEFTDNSYVDLKSDSENYSRLNAKLGKYENKKYQEVINLIDDMLVEERIAQNDVFEGLKEIGLENSLIHNDIQKMILSEIALLQTLRKEIEGL